MTVRVTFTVANDNPNTIHNVLKRKLGREPSHAELRAEVTRIRTEALVDMAGKGRLRMQR